MSATLDPNYLDIDFATVKQKIIDQLELVDVFKDYYYEGSNITILIELMSYVTELNTYFLNKIAKNTYIDTADVYEAIHSIAGHMGYYPKGYVSSKADLQITISDASSANPCNVSVGDVIKINQWIGIQSSETDDDGNIVTFTTPSVSGSELTFTVTALPYTFSIPVFEGKKTVFNLKGSDMIDNKFVLPLSYCHDQDRTDVYNTIEVKVNDSLWTRITDFYDEISGLSDLDTVYQFSYNKYGKYVVEFSDMRDVPTTTDDITITVLESVGQQGNVGANTITNITNTTTLNTTGCFCTNDTRGEVIGLDYITVTNPLPSLGGADPENVETIRGFAKSTLNTQYRNVTKSDYITYLEQRSDISRANVWGEQEVAPSGWTYDYNKVYISLIPTDWSTTSTATISLSGSPLMPIQYNTSWKNVVSRYLEPRKMLCTFEEYVLPELVYFKFHMGIRIKRTYKYIQVLRDLKEKIVYYFDPLNITFGDSINWKNILEYIMDFTISSATNDFQYVKGIRDITIRNIDVWNYVTSSYSEPAAYTATTYPRYGTVIDGDWDENILREILLDYNQFPCITIAHSTFEQEN